MSRSEGGEHLLDNPVWHSLRGPLARFVAADSTSELLHFDREVNIFSAIDRIDDTGWDRIGAVMGKGGLCALFRDAIPELPPGWETHFRGSCLQMMARDIPAPSGLEVDVLGAGDGAEMLELAELTAPGPFMARTGELGRYVGVRRDGRLIAMAGERFRVPGYVEVSGVCTHPDARGEGLAAELTLEVARSIRAAGDEAFLHVLDDNENAIRLYTKLGFVTRRTVDVVFAQWHGPDWRPEPTD